MEYKEIEKKLLRLKKKLDALKQKEHYKAFPLLLECAKLAKNLPCEGDEQLGDLLAIHLFVGDWYHNLGHYPFAIVQYKKVVEIAQNYEIKSDTKDALESCFCDLLSMYKKMSATEDYADALAVFSVLMPKEAASFEKRKSLGLKVDPFDVSEKYFEILPELQEKIAKRLTKQGVKRQHGFCYAYWNAKAEILEKDYGIEWDSPAVLNMGVHFD